jgi:hypothetical protein
VEHEDVHEDEDVHEYEDEDEVGGLGGLFARMAFGRGAVAPFGALGLDSRDENRTG